jgi:hypothetical protein
MKSSHQIVESILGCISQCYADPADRANTISELDALLFQLHWLLADATKSMDKFVGCRMELFEADCSGWRRIHMASDYLSPVTNAEQFSPIIEEWKQLDAAFGIGP